MHWRAGQEGTESRGSGHNDAPKLLVKHVPSARDVVLPLDRRVGVQPVREKHNPHAPRDFAQVPLRTCLGGGAGHGEHEESQPGPPALCNHLDVDDSESGVQHGPHEKVVNVVAAAAAGLRRGDAVNVPGQARDIANDGGDEEIFAKVVVDVRQRVDSLAPARELHDVRQAPGKVQVDVIDDKEPEEANVVAKVAIAQVLEPMTVLGGKAVHDKTRNYAGKYQLCHEKRHIRKHHLVVLRDALYEKGRGKQSPVLLRSVHNQLELAIVFRPAVPAGDRGDVGVVGE